MNKRKLILLIVFALLCSFVVSILFSKLEKHTEIKRDNYLKQEKEAEQEIVNSDPVFPVLTLKRNKLSIYQGDEINYKVFIKEASDNLEGDMVSSVNYNEIDTNQVGTYVVEYSLSDSAGNTVTADLEITVRPKIQFSGLD